MLKSGGRRGKYVYLNFSASKEFNVFSSSGKRKLKRWLITYVKHATDMYVGGSDTSSTTLEWAMAELLRNPATMRKAQEDVRRVVDKKSKVEEKDVGQMKYLECVVKETIRLRPPAPLLLPRETISSVKLWGYDIPRKTSVYINAWAIQRDPKIWERPEEFVPVRFESSKVEFKGQYF
ncbi:Cytochrome P450 71A1 [Senna tora]|uniref:Cytochrome P450 71A1 n=1 Tax=Senna tora TaxID=362788 RepID=A0A834X5L1_9FABA|nr:Cytochrome P450 71A1 [Senna tora]